MKRKQNTSTKRLQTSKALKQRNEVVSSVEAFTIGSQFNNNILDVNFLQKKYQEQKKIVSMQNKRLQEELIREMNLNEQRKYQLEKIEQRYQDEIQILKVQNQTLKYKLQLKLQQQNDPESFTNHENNEEEEEKEKSYLTMHKQLILKYQKLQQEYDELQQALFMEDQQKKHLQHQNADLVTQNENIKMKIIRDQSEFGKVKQLLQSYAQQKQQINAQFQAYGQKITTLEEQLERNKEKLAEQKKKKKQTEKLLKSLEHKFQAFQKQDKVKYQHKINQLCREIQSQRQKNIHLTTKLSFNQVSIQKKDNYLKEIQTILRETKEVKQTLEEKLFQTQKQINARREDVHKLTIAIESVKEDHNTEKSQINKKYEEQIAILKKKTIEEIYPILKDKNQERGKRNLQSYLRNCKSSGQFLKMPSQMINQCSNYENNRQIEGNHKGQHFQNPIQKYKLQSQINNLEMQKISLQKQRDLSNNQVHKMRSQTSDLKSQLDSKAKQLQQLNLEIQKVESNKSSQILQMRRQLASLRTKQTEALQMMRDRQEYQEAMNLKISFYDKKIKELLENIERKQSIIDKLKHHKVESQQKIKFYEEKLEKVIEQNQTLRRTKHDISRKDELLKDYKIRYEKTKSEQDEYREALQNLRKEKQKLVGTIQSKDQYISTLKKKQSKDMSELERSYEQKLKSCELKTNKTIKQNYQGKIKKIKKDYENVQQILIVIKQGIISNVQNLMLVNSQKRQKQKSQPNRNQFQNYEAAKLLGLNSAQIQCFLNPSKAADTQITSYLDRLWRNQQYESFVTESIKYIASKNHQGL